ncbi:MAG: M48 family metallopeptidase [Myxococcota bacterium]|nr:M48 family metallopeptidase [Myxococcota bacterium]
MILFFLTACLTNPATGRLQLNLIGDNTEIELGEQLAAETTATMPAVQDAALGNYVSDITRKLAALSERPELPWTITVLDEAAVNAFALPGGNLFITRGLMTWLGSEDELAAVIGHEIGHVTARHSANTLSRTILTAPLIGLVGALDPRMEHIGAVTGAGVGLARLGHSREDERQADDLGLRYLRRAGYDPSAMLDVFTVLETVDKAEGDRLPTWLLTHPAPADRKTRLGTVTAAGERVVGDYLTRIDGMVFGADPRQGYFEGDRFHHPQLAFRLDFPAGWTHSNQHTAVSSVSETGTATFALSLAPEETPEAAVAAFMEPREISEREGAGVGQAFRLSMTTAGAVRSVDGLVAAVRHGETVYRMVGVGSAEDWPEVEAAVVTTIESFAEEVDPMVLEKEPERLRVGEVVEMSMESFAGLHPRRDSSFLADLNRQRDGVEGWARWVE